MFPAPTTVRMVRCADCNTPVRADRLVAGRYGEKCARDRGLLGSSVDVGQSGPDLFDAADEDDACDGWDRI